LTSLSSVFVEVRPDTSHFSTDLKRSLDKTREAVEVAASLDTAKLKPQLDRLKTDLKSITVTKANITADSARASATVRGLKQELKGLSEKVKLEGDSTDLSNRITAVKAELKSVSDEKVKLSVDSSAASAHIKALTAQLGVFSREEDRAGAGGDGGGLGGRWCCDGLDHDEGWHGWARASCCWCGCVVGCVGWCGVGWCDGSGCCGGDRRVWRDDVGGQAGDGCRQVRDAGVDGRNWWRREGHEETDPGRPGSGAATEGNEARG
jgi:hypothetical protein